LRAQALPSLRPVNPTYKMPDVTALRRAAIVADVNNALCAARCSAQLAGLETREFVVRELLLTVIAQIDRAAAAVRRLG
jgi:hypothetical protein